MTTIEFNNGTDAHVLSSKPTTPLGGPRQLAVDSGEAITLIHFPLGSRIPDEADVTQAILRVYQAGNPDSWSGSTTLTAQRVGKWGQRTVTWNTKPPTSGVVVDATQSDTASGDVWEFDVTDDLADFHSGAVDNYGWQITSSSTARRYLRGFDANKLKPVLEVSYAELGMKPTDLRPGGGLAVGTTKPVLTFSAAGFTAIQVQVAAGGSTPAADGDGTWTSPMFDSGEVATTVPKFDLSTSTYGGLSSGTAQWHVRTKGSLGWSDWSTSAVWAYASLPVVTITNPTSITADPTPPVTWTAPGQVQRNVIVRVNGKKVEESGWATTDELAWTPTEGATADGDTLSVEVQVMDAEDRAATDGNPDYGNDVQVTTYAYADGIAPVTRLTAYNDGYAPWVVLTWQRTESADEWVIERRKATETKFERIARIDAATAATASTGIYRWSDWTVPQNRKHYWRVRPVVGGEVGGDDSPSTYHTPDGKGLWIGDPETGEQVVVWGQDPATWGTVEKSALFEPFNAARVIRHVYGRRGGPEGSLSGLLADVDGCPTADECEAQMLAWAEEPTRTFRMVAAHQNIEATLGDIDTSISQLDSPGQPVIPVSWSFWAVF